MIAPTGSGKTLAAFLTAINHLMFSPVPQKSERCRVLYISPLKALAVDVEKNLRVPIAGISAAATPEEGSLLVPTVFIRTGDTASAERAQFNKTPSDILITTPESLYLMLTSNARETLRSVRWVIVDEIHAMLGTKRGTHLAVSLERLQELVTTPFQRIGLSATQKPIEEAARFLGGGEISGSKLPKWKPRPVTVVDAGHLKELDVQVIVPVEDMSRLGEPIGKGRSGKNSQEPVRRSIWPSIYPKILEIIRSHRTTLLFVNSRRLAERVAAALNELAEEEIARAHHGSISREQRMQIEEDLKQGRLPAIVATSSLELGIDMGSIDLVIQIESPTSVVSALQRIGRSGHRAGAISKGMIFPKHRGDLLASAALSRQVKSGAIEEVRYLRNPLDVLAQQIVAMVSMDTWSIDDLSKVIRQSAPFADLTDGLLRSVLDMLSGRYPSEEFAGLRPRIVWDRIHGKLRAREGAKSIAIANAGTIPDRGLFPVFLAGAEPGKGRVGELDEEMVFETRTGETFLLGASTWRVEDITHDRVLVSPAPGEPGKMPFWKGDGPGRPLEFGRAIGKLTRDLQKMPLKNAQDSLVSEYGMNLWAARNLLAYLKEQQSNTQVVPDDRTIVVERYVDDLGDWRVCILSPFGGKVHAPWTHAIEAKIRKESGLHVETLWSDDGIVIRFPETEDAPPTETFLLIPDEVEDLVVEQMGASALFAGRFREASARALLLPRRYPGQRTPLWQQRKRASDLLQVTSKFQNFPMILEAYRELLRDVFDIPGLIQLLREIQNRSIRVVTVNTRKPSPFASTLMFGYIGNFIYEGDAPLAERRAQALSVDPVQLRELLGETELRELLDPDIIDLVELQLQNLEPKRKIKHPDALQDLLMRLGDLSAEEVLARCGLSATTMAEWLSDLQNEHRVVPVQIAKESRWIVAEDAAKYRDALGIAIPPGLPAAFLEKVMDPIFELIGRYARTHGPFHAQEVAVRFGLGIAPIENALQKLESAGRVVRGAFRRGRHGEEWCEISVLRMIRQKSLARLRSEVEPVEPSAYGRFLPEWHRIGHSQIGPDALMEVIGQLQGCPVPASVLETQILPARLAEYDSRDLDILLSSGHVLWSGVESLGQNDGRIALYLSEHAAKLWRPPEVELKEKEMHEVIRHHLKTSGASFFPQIVAATDGSFKREVLSALWDLVWAGEVTNDTLLPLRALISGPAKSSRKRQPAIGAARSSIPPSAAGRWSLVSNLLGSSLNKTEKSIAMVHQFLDRLGIVTREAIAAEKLPGGFSAVYPVFKALEEAGKIRRGYFIAGCGVAQFADPGALDRLRSMKDADDPPRVVVLAATDPANPYGATLAWPSRSDNLLAGRTAGAQVILVDGVSRRVFLARRKISSNVCLGNFK